MASDADKARFRDALAAATDKYVKQQGRNTIALNAENDPACAGYARIPGPDACDFCVTMGATNDFYHTEKTAGGGELHGTTDDHYHPHCNCQVCVVFRKRGKLVARDPQTGEAVPYDPADMLRRYEEVGRPTFSGGSGGTRLSWQDVARHQVRLESAASLDELRAIGAEIERAVPKHARQGGKWKALQQMARKSERELKG